MKSNHEDLRQIAVEALANYMHHRLFDVAGLNMMEFARSQAGGLVGAADRALERLEGDPFAKQLMKGLKS